jgi:ATP-dependent RNA helicase DeaD
MTTTRESTVTPSFTDLGLRAETLRAIEELGYEAPTPIQAQTIGLMKAGRDVIAQAQTGTGKTAAYAIPMVERVDPRERYVQALVMAPTRELAVQVAEATNHFGRARRVHVLPVYAGQPIERQLRALQHGVHVVVGTPGRLLDHLRRGTLALDRVNTVVLDEADQMLDMGFLEEVEVILDATPSGRQTALFSATMPAPIVELSRKYLREPERVTVARETLTVPQTRQTVYEVPGPRKLDALTRILDWENPASAIIFCRTKSGVDELAEALEARGYLAEPIHGDLSQIQRDRVMGRFRTGEAELLIATDVAARGLDIPEVTHVINYDIPMDPESYVHRIGRTGRAGRPGEAVTLVEPRERRLLRMIEQLIRQRITPVRVPSLADVAARRRERFKNEIAAIIDEGELDAQLLLVQELCEEYDPVEIAAAAFKRLGDLDGKSVQVETLAGDETAERGMTRLFVKAGRKEGIHPLVIVRVLAEEAGIPSSEVGAIDIFDHFTFVEVPSGSAAHVIQTLNRTKWQGKRLQATPARPRGR